MGNEPFARLLARNPKSQSQEMIHGSLQGSGAGALHLSPKSFGSIVIKAKCRTHPKMLN